MRGGFSGTCRSPLGLLPNRVWSSNCTHQLATIHAPLRGREEGRSVGVCVLLCIHSNCFCSHLSKWQQRQPWSRRKRFLGCALTSPSSAPKWDEHAWDKRSAPCPCAALLCVTGPLGRDIQSAVTLMDRRGPPSVPRESASSQLSSTHRLQPGAQVHVSPEQLTHSVSQLEWPITARHWNDKGIMVARTGWTENNGSVARHLTLS